LNNAAREEGFLAQKREESGSINDSAQLIGKKSVTPSNLELKARGAAANLFLSAKSKIYGKPRTKDEN